MPVKQVWGFFRGDKLSEFMKYAIQLAQMVKGQTELILLLAQLL